MEGETCNCLASFIKIGIITTTKGVLLTKAETSVTPSPRSTRVRTGFASTLRDAIWLAHSNAPVRTKAPTITNIAAIVQGALFDNTPATSCIGKMPSKSIRAAPEIAVTSTG